MKVCRMLMLCRDVLEHLWLVVLLWSLSRTLTTWTSWASVIAAWTTVVITTWTAVVATVVVTAWTSVSAWLALWLYISLWLLKESLAGESHLAALLIDLEELHVYLVAYLEDILYLLGLLWRASCRHRFFRGGDAGF